MIRFPKPSYLLAILLIFAAASPVVSAEQDDLSESQESEWHTQDGRLTLTVPSSVDQRGGMQITSVEYMSADRTDGPGGVGFMCANGGLIVAISLEGRESTHKLISQTITADANKQRMIRPQLVIGGKKQSNTQWMFSTRSNVIVPLKPSVAKKIYNAAILGHTVTLKSIRRTDDFDLHLPAPNQDFAYYGGGCGMGRNAGK